MPIYGDLEHEKAIEELKKWFEDNEQLPSKIDRTLLWRLYIRSSQNIEETKKLLELNYTIRLKNPHMFIDRDPTDADTKNASDYVYMCPLPKLTPSNLHITFVKFHNTDPKMMHFTEDIKTFLMITDCRFAQPDVRLDGSTPSLSEGEIIIMDMEGIGMKHAARFKFGTMNVIFKYLYQAFPDRVREIHLINCPSYVNKILAVVKPFMSKELYEMIKCHSNGLDSLYEHVPRDILPNEYGGSAGELSILFEQFKKVLVEKRDYLMDANYWKIQKS